MRLPPFIHQLQNRTAEAAIGHSTLRNQGAPKINEIAREVLKKLDLGTFSRATRFGFLRLLDDSTESMRLTFPAGAQNWGAARKAINIFLRDATYNRDLSEYYSLERIRHWLEVPLDKDVATALRNEAEGFQLMKWPRIKHVSPSESREFQAVATDVAFRKRICRVDLDIYYWRAKSGA